MKKFGKIIIGLMITLVVLIVAFLSIYMVNIGPVSRDKELKEIVIEKGETFLTIAPLLKQNNLIKSEFFYKLYIKVNKPQTFEAGIYKLSENMGVEKIVKEISSGSDYNGEIIRITFVEGETMDYVASMIAKNTINTKDDVLNLLQNKNYIDELINKYWFLTEDVKNSKIYFPLEGYLFPDTYEFLNKNVSVEEIFEKMLDNMGEKLEKFKEQINENAYSIHELMTIASLLEREGKVDGEKIAGVIYNRLADGIKLDIDATTYYGSKIYDWCDDEENEPDDNSCGLTKNHLIECNSYNTRGDCTLGLPVGPIANPSLNSIEATLNPENHDYTFYVHDCTGKIYLDYTDSAQQKTIAKLRKENNWCES